MVNHPPSPLKGGVNPESLHESGVLSYNLDLLGQGRIFRKNQTTAEQKLWNEILRSRKTGYKFTRQKPVDQFILDFYCSALLFTIEVDGEIHEKQKEKDKQRTQKLNSIGIKVIHFTNNQVLNEIEEIKSKILIEIQEREQELNVPPFKGARG